LLEELRALIPGRRGPVRLPPRHQRYVYYGTLLTTAVALVFLLAPSAYHRLRFREGDKDAMVRKGNREAIAGTGAIALAFTGVLYLITDLVFHPSRGRRGQAEPRPVGSPVILLVILPAVTQRVRNALNGRPR
jgi:hypothetical protein